LKPWQSKSLGWLRSVPGQLSLQMMLWSDALME
jgi:hypothetical protein